jgi:WD40 repeat protein
LGYDGNGSASLVYFTSSKVKRLLAFVILALPLWALQLGHSESDGSATHSEKPRLTPQLGQLSQIESVAFSNSGQFVITGGAYHGTAVLWDAETGAELTRFEVHQGDVNSVVFSRDDRWLLTGGEDGSARLWDAKTGEQIRRFEGHTGAVEDAVLSADGSLVLTGSRDNTARLWDAATGSEIHRFQGHNDFVTSVALSPDGSLVLTGSRDGTARIWNARTGTEIRRIPAPSGFRCPVAFSPDGRIVLTSGGMEKWVTTHTASGATVQSRGAVGLAVMWDIATGVEIRRLEGYSDWVRALSFSPDGRFVLTGGDDHTARLWNAETGKELRRFEGHTSDVKAVAFSRDGRRVLTGSNDSSARVWDANTGGELVRFIGLINRVNATVLSQDGRFVLTGSYQNNGGGVCLWDASSGIIGFRLSAEGTAAVAMSPDSRFVLLGDGEGARLWDVDTHQMIRRFERPKHVFAVAFSSDGHFVLLGGDDGRSEFAAILFDARTGAQIRSFKASGGTPTSVGFSEDGQRVMIGVLASGVTVLNTQTGVEVRRFDQNITYENVAAFSPNGRFLLTSSGDLFEGTAVIWEVATGAKVGQLAGHKERILAVAFSSNGRYALTGSYDKTARLWDITTGTEIRRFVGHWGWVNAVAFSRDDRIVVTGSEDGTTRLWDAGTGRELCSLVSFNYGTWAVVEPGGRYDASNGGDVEGLHWVVGNEPIALNQLKERYYEPGLLAKVLGFNKEPLRQIEAFTDPKLYPKVSVTPPDTGNPRLGIHLSSQGGGIGRVQVLINGKEAEADARGHLPNPGIQQLDLSVDIANNRYLKQGEENVFEVRAYNSEEYLVSRGVQVRYKAPGEKTSPSFWAIVAGTSDYAGGDLHLWFAAKDAQDMAGALHIAAERLFGKERTHITLLTTAKMAGVVLPTRENLKKAFEAARQAKSTDILVVYLSGHGVNYGGQGGQEADYYYLTQEARSGDLTDPEVRRQTAVSSQELTEWIKQIPVTKQVLVLDTCAAARLVEKLTEKRDVPSSQIRSLERMKDRTGFYILAGSAADAVSYEASRYGQGLLTHSLLVGMRGAALRENRFVDVNTWFAFATEEVPKLAKDIGGIQKPRPAIPYGGESFDVGMLLDEDKAQIHVASVRPLFLQSNFQDEVRFIDHLKLAARVNEALREVSVRGAGASLVYVDASEYPDGYLLTGRYRVAGSSVKVRVTLFKGEKEAANFTVEGITAEIDKVAQQIVDEAGRVLRDSR